MSDYTSRRISEAELSVMETLWETGEPMTAKDLQTMLKERRGWERTTVRSLLTRLQEKGSLQVTKTPDATTYAPVFTKEEYGWDLAEVLVERLYDSSAKELVAALMAHGVLSKADLAGL